MVMGLLTNGDAIVRWRPDSVHLFPSVLQLLATVCTSAFYLLLVVTYLRRVPAKATVRSAVATVAAVVATLLPVELPYTATRTESSVSLLFGNLMIAVGVGFAVWGLSHLDKSFSIIPQARELVTDGPYRMVRHPLYTGEILATYGVAMVYPSAFSFALATLLLALQWYRSTHEERVLTSVFPEYREYAAGVGRLLPGIGKGRG